MEVLDKAGANQMVDNIKKMFASLAYSDLNDKPKAVQYTVDISDLTSGDKAVTVTPEDGYTLLVGCPLGLYFTDDQTITVSPRSATQADDGITVTYNLYNPSSSSPETHSISFWLLYHKV